jgi:hypothetical protein
MSQGNVALPGVKSTRGSLFTSAPNWLRFGTTPFGLPRLQQPLRQLG